MNTLIQKIIMLSIVCFTLWSFLSSGNVVKAANPYLPLWEHIPDGEPRLFEDPDKPGKYRVYLYGSHDTRRYAYCGYEIPVWSAPAEDLNDWRYDGIGFQSIVDGVADVLFAPDVVEVVDADGQKTYYMYPNNQGPGRLSQVAKSNRPDGPFEVINWREGTTHTEGVMGFDPAAFIDDDGRVYGYWGFIRSFAVELDPNTMYSAKPGASPIADLIGSCEADDGNVFRFFEAPSLRKIGDKYVLVYSRKTANGEYGLGESNSTLAYAYADAPLGPWTYGGTIVDARGPEINEAGRMVASQPSHNTHGSILEVDGQWYIFYHRSTNNDGFSRQAMVEPINLEITPEGEVVITGTRIIKDDFGNEYTGAEVTSQGFEINGLNPLNYHSAGITSYMIGGPYVKATYDTWRNEAPVVNIRSNSIVGYKYFNFSAVATGADQLQLETYLTPMGVGGTIEVMVDSPWEKRGGKQIGSFQLPDGLAGELTKIVFPINKEELDGKRAIFFVFKSDRGNAICELNGLKFTGTKDPLEKSTIVDLDKWDLENLVPPALNVFVDGTALTGFEISDYDYNVFQYNYLVSPGTTTVPKVTAEASDEEITVAIQQADGPLGKAVVEFSQASQTKRYEISFSSFETLDFSAGMPEDWEVVQPSDQGKPLGSITTSEDTISIKTHKRDWDYPHSHNKIQLPHSITGDWEMTVKVSTSKPLGDLAIALNTQVGLAVFEKDTKEFFKLATTRHGSDVKANVEARIGEEKINELSGESLGDSNTYWLRLVKSGNNLAGYFSLNGGSSWNSVGNRVSFPIGFFEKGNIQLFAANQSLRTDLEANYSISIRRSDSN